MLVSPRLHMYTLALRRKLALGAAARLEALAIPGGHRFDSGLTWPAFGALLDG